MQSSPFPSINYLRETKKISAPMASVCTTRCLDDARVPVRASYVSLYKWPESDAAFVRSVSSNGRDGSNNHHPTVQVVDSISCRQMYLRSYTFTRKKESVPERTIKCFGRVKERAVCTGKLTRGVNIKGVSCASLIRAFNRLLSCTTKVDVVD